MKYGKEFQQILDDPSLPLEWKSSAIEYRRLKRLIKDVVSELSGMGLSPNVLQTLLITEDDNERTALAIATPAAPVHDNAGRIQDAVDQGDVLEFEFESDESPPTLSTGVIPSAPHLPSSRAKEVIIDPILDDGPGDEGSSRRSAEAGPSSLPIRSTAHSQHRKFRLRLLSESSPAAVPVRPIGVTEMMRIHVDRNRDPQEKSKRRRHSSDYHGKGRKVRSVVADGHGSIKAEYVLAGDSAHPIPQLRLHLPANPAVLESVSPVSPSTGTSDPGETSDEGDVEPEPVRNGYSPPHRTPQIGSRSTPPPVPDVDRIPPSPALKSLRAAPSPIWALATSSDGLDGFADLFLGDTPQTVLPEPEPPSNSSLPPEREFIVPLSSDLAFFNLLTAALTSLSAFHVEQQSAFRQSVASLCAMISRSIQPEAAISVLPTPLAPLPSTRLQHRSSRASKRDLYAWREIFTLWIEAEIFESTSERTRGERTVEQAETRLKAFANEVVKRRLGDRRTMTGKRTREAWEEFLRLNVLLLDLKRFQMANINAARKILKKHDKRTALTASAGFPSLVRSTSSAHVDKDGNISTWAFYNTSLPHVLLASLTDTLLPILPSLDDYACLICTSIAFKPIRLGCGHLFCVRCLVKMQRAGKAECPLCRSKVVLLADKNSLDLALMNFMKEWFPKEVRLKRKENETEVGKELLEGSGLDSRCSIM